MANNDTLLLFECIKEHYEAPNRSRFMALTESEKASVARNLIDRIYVNIAEKYNTVDFGTIPASNGYINNMPEYKNLKASIELLNEIAVSSNQVIPEISVLSKSLANIEIFGDKFHTGFIKKNAAVIMMYNLLTMSLYCGTSLMISTLVDYINLANTEIVQVIISKKYSKTNSYLMLASLKQFNDQVADGSFSKNMETISKPQQLQEGAVAVLTTTVSIVLGVIGIFKIIPLTKEIIYLFYYSRLKLSQAAEIQANLINANSQALQGTNVANKTVRIQKWVADKLTTISHVFAFNYEKSEKQAEVESQQKLTQSDIVLF
jgi:hypothetical protein